MFHLLGDYRVSEFKCAVAGGLGIKTRLTLHLSEWTQVPSSQPYPGQLNQPDCLTKLYITLPPGKQAHFKSDNMHDSHTIGKQCEDKGLGTNPSGGKYTMVRYTAVICKGAD